VGSGATGLAGRYASALYALAVESKKIDTIHDELGTFAKHIEISPDLKALIVSPVLSRDQQQKAILSILKNADADKLTQNFVCTLAANGRLAALPQIVKFYQEEHARRQGQISAEVISAVSLDEKRKGAVKKIVGRIAGSDKVFIAMRVDPSLIGGLVVRIGSRMIDTSIKSKLNRLETAMKGMA